MSEAGDYDEGGGLLGILGTYADDAIVSVDVDYDDLEGYGSDEGGPGSMAWYDGGCTAGWLIDQIRSFAADHGIGSRVAARRYFEHLAEETGRAEKAEGARNFRVFRLEGWPD